MPSVDESVRAAVAAAAVAAPSGEAASQSSAGDAEVVLAKQDGERSFGMSILMDRRVCDAQFAFVSCVIPHSPAFRAGLQEGRQAIRRSDLEAQAAGQ